ncbi:MAG: YD repeat-containing protein [Paraglaciecola sp.]|jgi:YD repeat-containing protein
MSFYYHMYGSDIGTLAVEVYYQGKWSRICQSDKQKHTSTTSAWTQQTLSLAFYPGAKSIRFAAIAPGGYKGDLAVDEVAFFDRSATTFLRYRYDDLGRVICVEDNINGDRDFDYDDAGNRKQVAVGDCNE